MNSVSSNAVYDTLGGSKIKTYSNTVTLYDADLSSRGYFSVNIPAEINNGNVIGVHLSTNSIAISNALQMTVVYAENTSLYINYYRPLGFQQSSIKLTVKITYIV